jgi:general secretion pathway protein D
MSQRKELLMRNVVCLIVLAMLVAHEPVGAAEGMPAARVEGVPLRSIIESVSERLNKSFIVDPRVDASVAVVGVDLKRISYAEFQAILEVHGFAAIEDGKLTKIIPAANARQVPTPLVDDRNSSIGDSAIVTKIVSTAPLQASQLVPILRPMMPQQAHLVADAKTNTLILVDTYANVLRIEKIVRELQKRPIVAE